MINFKTFLRRSNFLTFDISQFQKRLHKEDPACVLRDLGLIKRSSKKDGNIPGVDFVRGLCFLKMGDYFSARQALLEEKRLFPHSNHFSPLLHKLNSMMRSILSPPIEVQEKFPLFALLFDSLVDYTMLTWPRLLSLFKHISYLEENHIEGDIIECGSSGGGSVILMAVALANISKKSIKQSFPRFKGKDTSSSLGLHKLSNTLNLASPAYCDNSFSSKESVMGINNSSRSFKRKIYACDTFTGMPPPQDADALVSSSISADDSHWGCGTCSGTEERILWLAKQFDVEIIPVKGDFEETLQTLSPSSLALLHIDADWYQSTKIALELLFPKVTRNGGIVQIDDYFYWDGCHKAVDEYLDLFFQKSEIQKSITFDSPSANFEKKPTLHRVDDAVYLIRN